MCLCVYDRVQFSDMMRGDMKKVAGLPQAPEQVSSLAADACVQKGRGRVRAR